MFTDFPASGPMLHFAHANGYPPAAYQPLFDALKPHYQVRAPLARPLWPNAQPEEVRSWWLLVDDLLAYLAEQNEKPILAVGHSLGAVCWLAAALRRPELFRALVLIEPVLFRERFLLLWGAIRGLGLGRRVHPLIPGALRRRRIFANTEEMFTRYRRAQTFKRLDDDALHAYVNALARPCADGQVELSYTPEWEVKIYETGLLNLWRDLPRLQVPLCLIYGTESDTFLPPAARKFQRLLPSATLHAVPETGHLVPLEAPAKVAGLMMEFFKAQGVGA